MLLFIQAVLVNCSSTVEDKLEKEKGNEQVSTEIVDTEQRGDHLGILSRSSSSGVGLARSGEQVEIIRVRCVMWFSDCRFVDVIIRRFRCCRRAMLQNTKGHLRFAACVISKVKSLCIV